MKLAKLHLERVFTPKQNKLHENRVINYTIPFNPQHDFILTFDLLNFKTTSHAKQCNFTSNLNR